MLPRWRLAPIGFGFLLLCGSWSWAVQQPVGQNDNRLARGQVHPGQQAAAGPMVPFWVADQTVEHQKYVRQILEYWQHRTSEIKRYRCNFQRWDYDPVFGPKDPKVFKTYSKGVIKYSAPDKGLFKVETMQTYRPGEDGKTRYVEVPDREQWVCDGKSIFEFDYQQSKLIEVKLPPEMHGKAIVDGPLPFLFGANADDIQRRYWIRVVTPEGAKNEYWLEAVPKTQADAANFRAVLIVLAEADYLPARMVLYGRDDKKTTFQFDDREVNFNILINQLNVFHREFFEPAIPSGWQKEVRDHSGAGVGPN